MLKQGSTLIISGKWKRKKIKFYLDEGVRPTLSRVRQTMFDWLMHDVCNATCLDLFSGSGILGLEALSRGAEKVTFVDSNKRLITSIKQQLSALKAEPASYSLYCTDFSKLLQPSFGTVFDIVFIDPPYDKFLIEDVLLLLKESGRVSEGSLIVFEASAIDFDKISVHYEIVRAKTIKNLSYGLLKIK